MGRVLRMPGEDQLPPGPQREFAMALFAYYQFAARPTLRKIAELISQKHPDVTGSPETVRRTLLGLSTPTRWNTVDAMLAVLSDLANMDPAAARPPLDDGSGESFNSPHKPKAEIRVLWNAALDAAPRPLCRNIGALCLDNVRSMTATGTGMKSLRRIWIPFQNLRRIATNRVTRLDSRS